MSIGTHGSGCMPDTGMQVNAAGEITFLQGTVPSDAAVGYAKGCICINTSGSDHTDTLYVNIGTAASADFNAATLAS